MKKNLKKGFTLIELLVVVAIIGILASVVLASLNSARTKGSDAAVKANLANIRAEAAIYYDTNNYYGTSASSGGATGCTTLGTLFAADSTVKSQVAAATAAGSGLNSCWDTTGSAGAWAVAVPLKSSTTAAWCVDSSGASKAETPVGITQANLDAVITASACN